MKRICLAAGCESDLSHKRKGALYCDANCTARAYYTGARIKALAVRPFRACGNPDCHNDISQRPGQTKFCSPVCTRIGREPDAKTRERKRQARADYLNNRELRLTNKRAWRAKNRKRDLATKRRFYHKHKARLFEKNKEFSRKHREKLQAALAICRELGIEVKLAA